MFGSIMILLAIRSPDFLPTALYQVVHSFTYTPLQVDAKPTWDEPKR